MRAILGSILVGLAGACHAEAQWKQPVVVDLNQPGALDRVARENPAHYHVIASMMRTLREKSCEEVLKVHRAGMTPVWCSAFSLRTSFPPKRHLSVTLDGVSYMANVTVDAPARLMKAR